MISRRDCVVIIPCLNEAASIEKLVGQSRKHIPVVLVMDDGSADQTANLAKQAGAEVLRHSRSKGKAAALLAAWRWAHERGFPWALSLDGDGQHSPEDIPAFLDAARRSGADLIVGNRMEDPRAMPRVRRFVNRWMSARISALAGRCLPDSQCGFRLMNLNRWSGLEISATHFQIESEVLLAFARAGLRIEFAPIQVIYRHERSKIRPVRDALRWFHWWWRARSDPKPDREVPETGQSQEPGFLASRMVRAPK